MEDEEAIDIDFTEPADREGPPSAPQQSSSEVGEDTRTRMFFPVSLLPPLPGATMTDEEAIDIDFPEEAEDEDRPPSAPRRTLSDRPTTTSRDDELRIEQTFESGGGAERPKFL